MPEDVSAGVGETESDPDVVTQMVTANEADAAPDAEVLGLAKMVADCVALPVGQGVTVSDQTPLVVRFTLPVTALLNVCVTDPVLVTEGVKQTETGPVAVPDTEELSLHVGVNGGLCDVEGDPDPEGDPVADPPPPPPPAGELEDVDEADILLELNRDPLGSCEPLVDGEADVVAVLVAVGEAKRVVVLLMVKEPPIVREEEKEIEVEVEPEEVTVTVGEPTTV